MRITGRSVDSDKYRYGFNGKEKEESGEFGSLTHYDYGFRIYNPGIAKFLSVDPLTRSYPELTPYQFASNTPIQAIDQDGMESIYYSIRFDNTGKSELKVEHVVHGTLFDAGYHLYVSYNKNQYHIGSGTQTMDRFFAWIMPETKELNGVEGQTRVLVGKTKEFIDGYFINKETLPEKRKRESAERGAYIQEQLEMAFMAGVGGKKGGLLDIGKTMPESKAAKASFKSFNSLDDLGQLFKNKSLANASNDLVSSGWKKLEGNWGTRSVFEKLIGKQRYYAQWEVNAVHSKTKQSVGYWKLTYGKINATSKNTIRVSPSSNFKL